MQPVLSSKGPSSLRNYLHRHGYALLIIGDAQHPEVEAIRSYIQEGVDVVEDVEAVQGLGPWEKLGIIAQTTQSFSLFKEVVAVCLERAKELRVFNTICHATTVRQMEAVEIAKKVDCMIVIGGYNSGNTQRLAAICRDIQPHTYHIETAQELHPRWLHEERENRPHRWGFDSLLDHQGGRTEDSALEKPQELKDL